MNANLQGRFQCLYDVIRKWKVRHVVKRQQFTREVLRLRICAYAIAGRIHLEQLNAVDDSLLDADDALKIVDLGLEAHFAEISNSWRDCSVRDESREEVKGQHDQAIVFGLCK